MENNSVKKFVILLVLLLMLSIVFVSFPHSELKAQTITIYIMADGNVEGTDNIQREGNVYTFTTDAVIDGDIVVQKSNILIDGNGHMLQNARLVISGLNNITVKNVHIKDTYYGTHGISVGISGIDVKNSSFITIMNNTVTGTTFYSNEAGIRIIGGNSNVIVGNTLSHNQKGLTISNTVDFETFIPIEVLVYDNNFYNDFDVEFSLMSGSNIPNSTIRFDNGTRGNFWYKYNGTDTDGDGIGDTPYIISSSVYFFVDDYPLMKPYGNPIVEVTEFSPWILLVLLLLVAMFSVFRRKLTK